MNLLMAFLARQYSDCFIIGLIKFLRERERKRVCVREKERVKEKVREGVR